MKLFKIFGGIVVGVAAVAAAPFTGGGSLLAGAAALGLGTAAAVAGAVGAGVVGGVLGSLWDDDDNNSETKRKLGILGMERSGKTTLLSKMRGITKSPTQTFSENYEEFIFRTHSGKIIKIAKGKDIGGNINYLIEYKTITVQSDVIFYFFNANEYVKDLDYRRQCNSRLSLIFSNLINKKFVLIGTHADKSSLTITQLKDAIMALTIEKKYSKLFNENLIVVNLTDNEQFANLTDNLFS